MFRKRGKATMPRGTELPPPTQEHLHVRGVLEGDDGTGYLLADDGTLAGGVIVSPIDLGLASVGEREMWERRFAEFLSSLDFQTPIQIVIGSRPQTCDEYRERVRASRDRFVAKADEAADAGDEAVAERRLHMAELAGRQLALFEHLLQEVRPREETYVVVVWENAFPILKGRREMDTERLAKGMEEVAVKVGRVLSGLSHMGLEVRRATAEDLTAMVYEFYHMTSSAVDARRGPAVVPGAVIDAAERADSGGRGENG